MCNQEITAGARFIAPSKGRHKWHPYKSVQFILILMTFVLNSTFAANEIIEDTHAKVVLKKHPKTGMPYVTIAPENAPEPAVTPQLIQRPNYRMLDPKIKSSQIPYEGPYSSRKKVYVFAATIATLGAAGGTAIIAAAPAATGAGAAGGAGAYAAAGGAVTAGTISTAWFKTRPDPNKENFTHDSKSKVEQQGSSRFGAKKAPHSNSKIIYSSSGARHWFNGGRSREE